MIVAAEDCDCGGGSYSYRVASMYPHPVFQGEILEGLVIRYVSYPNIGEGDGGGASVGDGDGIAGSEHRNRNHMAKERERERALEEMNRLCAASKEILTLVPPAKILHVPVHANNINGSGSGSGGEDLLRVDLRKLAELQDFEKQVQIVLDKFHGTHKRRVCRLGNAKDGNGSASHNVNGDGNENSMKQINLVQIATDILSSNDNGHHAAADFETRQIAQLIHTLDALKLQVSYKVMVENTMSMSQDGNGDGSGSGGGRERTLCIVHVHHDSSFQKYHQVTHTQNSHSSSRDMPMMLFRGFSIELLSEEDVNVQGDNKNDNPEGSGNMRLRNGDISTPHHTDTSTGTGGIPNSNSSIIKEEKLMLKMKFLPYMVRTFICRNGLSILHKSGIPAFENYAIGQLTKWQISEMGMTKWMPFFRGWALYCQSYCQSQSQSSVPQNNNSAEGQKKILPPLTSGAYLHHYNEFSGLFATGQFQPLANDCTTFRGLVVIVGPAKGMLGDLANAMSNELHCSKVVNDIASVSENDMLLSMQRHCGGMVCVAEIEDGVKNIRNLAKTFENALYIVMVGCLEEEELEATCVELEMNHPNRIRKIKGMAKSWRKTKCNLLLDLPKNANANAVRSDSDPNANVNETLDFLRADAAATDVLRRLEESSQSYHTDERPGLIVFFPAIPGSGKSSVCRDITADALGIPMGNDTRRLLLREGDQVKKKFYNVVEKDVLDAPACVAVLDKNVPPVSWPAISNLCTKSRSIAAAVLPMRGMQDTFVGDNVTSHVYPFSLHYLATCMSRVLNREANSHPGKLDSAFKHACMVVVKFYCLYRNITTAKMKERMSTMGASTNLEIDVPFFKGETTPELPEDLKLVLQDAINLQTREDLKTGEVDDGIMDHVENRLRLCVRKHQCYLDNLTTPLSESREVFRSQLSKAIDSLSDKLKEKSADRVRGDNEGNTSERIKVVSLDFDCEAVRSALDELKKDSSEVETYFAEREEHTNNDENDKELNRFITSLHCTFVHASRASQGEMYKSFNHLLGVPVETNATAILFSDTVAAIEVEIPKFASNNPPSLIPLPDNEFAHITLWCAKKTAAFNSNMLPGEVKSNSAKRVVFKEPVALKGVFSFWYHE